MNYRGLILAAAAALIVNAGCGSTSNSTDGGSNEIFVGACTTDATRCTDVYVTNAADVAQATSEVSSQCTARGATPSSTPCPTANRVGTCLQSDTVPAGNDGGTIPIVPKDRIYPGFSGDAAAACTQHGGTYTAG